MTNPIIQRELIGMLRTQRALVLQVLLLVVLAALVLLRWPTDARADVSGEQAQQVLRVFGYGLMTALILLAPVFPATSIVSEKQRGTLALLLNSPMSPIAIFLGKVIGSMGYIGLLLVLSLPAAAACLAMGGVDLAQLGRMYLVLGMLGLFYTCLALLVSSYASTTDAALRITYGLILLLAIISLGPYQFMAGSPYASDQVLILVDWVRAMSPMPAMMEAMRDVGAGEAGLGDLVNRFSLLALVGTLVCSVWTTARLNQRIFDQARDAGQITDEASAGRQAYRRIMYLWFFDPQRRGDLIGLQPMRILGASVVAAIFGVLSTAWFLRVDLEGPVTHTLLMTMIGAVPAAFALAAAIGVFWMILSAVPVAVKEQKSNRFGRSHWMMRLIGGCLIVSLGLMLLTTMQTEDMGVGTLGGIMVLLQVALIVLLTPSLASGIISQERESGGWQLLQMTPLSSFNIVFGKLLSVTWTLGLVLLATLPAYLVLVAIDPGMTYVALRVLTTLVLTAVMALLLSAALSSLFPRTAGATASAYALLLLICAGTMLFWLAEDAPFARSTVEMVLAVNPLAAALSLIETPGFDRYDLVPINWWIVGGLCVLSLLVLVARTYQLTRPR